MSDEITVRVTLDKSALFDPTTRVYVQVPEVARAEFLLPASRFEWLKGQAWPEVLDVALEFAVQGWAKASPAASARYRIAEWLRDPANRDEVQAAWEVDHVRRDPVARKLAAEVERLRARVAELEAGIRWRDAERRRWVDVQYLVERAIDKGWSTVDTCDLEAELGPEAVAPAVEADGITQRIAPTQALRASREEPNDSPLHHDWLVGRDLPAPDGGA